MIWLHCPLTRSWLFLYILCSSKWRLLQGRLCSRSTSEFWCHCWSLTEKWCGIMNSNGSTIFCERDVLHYLDVKDISWYNPIRLRVFWPAVLPSVVNSMTNPLSWFSLIFQFFNFTHHGIVVASGCNWLLLLFQNKKLRFQTALMMGCYIFVPNCRCLERCSCPSSLGDQSKSPSSMC